MEALQRFRSMFALMRRALLCFPRPGSRAENRAAFTRLGVWGFDP
jgi:hypothetical protein